MARKKVIVTNFARGITSDPREPNTAYAQMVKNFDAHTFQQKLVPFRSSVDGDSSSSTSKKENFAVALRTGTTYSIYALGVKSGASTAEVLYKDFTASSSNDLSDATWAATSNNQSSTGATNFNLFVYYAKTGLIYGARAGTHIWTYDPSGSAAWADSHQALTYTNIAQGLVHSKDDILYVPYDNKIAVNNNGSWTTTALTLPAHLVIRSICEYGNYLAIGAAPLSGVGNSVVYLWDRDTTQSTVSESIDFGEGYLQILEQIEGTLIGISYQGIQTGANVATILGKYTFRAYAGGTPVVFQELRSEATSALADLPIRKQKVNQHLYFLLEITLNGTKQEGLWKVGRAVGERHFSVVMDRPVNNDTALTLVADTLKGFIVVGDYVFIAYVDNGVYKVSKTSSTTTDFTATASYESLVFTGGDSAKKKKLVGVSVMHEPMPASGSVVVKYKKDEDISYGTTILTSNTENAISKSATRDADGATLPEFNEISFKIESTGRQAIVTGLKFAFDEREKETYE